MFYHYHPAWPVQNIPLEAMHYAYGKCFVSFLPQHYAQLLYYLWPVRVSVHHVIHCVTCTVPWLAVNAIFTESFLFIQWVCTILKVQCPTLQQLFHETYSPQVVIEHTSSLSIEEKHASWYCQTHVDVWKLLYQLVSHSKMEWNIVTNMNIT